VTVASFTDAVAEAIAEASVTVQALPTTTSTSTSTTVAVRSTGQGRIPRTGTEGGSQALFGAGILMVGFGLVLLSRRRTASPHPAVR
jgi:LPXTG-motif cell wall-anchored protein